MHFAFSARMLRLGTDQCIVQTVMVVLAMVMPDETSSRFPHRPFAVQIRLRGGSFTEATPASASVLRNSAVKQRIAIMYE
jgi:hypothetical protein